LIDGTMTANFKTDIKIDGKMPSYQDSIIINSIRQTESVSYYHRAGLSYTVASREFVRQIPNTSALKAVVNL